MNNKNIGIWFPTICAGTGADIFTIRLAQALQSRGIQTEITWLPHHAEYMPWTVPVPQPPAWATVVHVNSWLHGRFIPRHLPLVATVHSCVHDTALSPYKNPFQKIYHRFCIRGCETHIFNRAQAVTAVSHYTQSQTELIFSCKKIVPILNWIDADVFSPREGKIPHSPFRLLFSGNLSKRKGVDLLGKIMGALGSGFQLDITCNRNELKKLIPSPANITALGRANTQAEMAQFYRNSDALLLPSRLEGLPLVALEAQSCGIPVIATNSSSFPEAVMDGVTGLLCPQDDIEAFANAARNLRANCYLWNKMCQAARMHAKEQFNEEKAINAYLLVYQTLNSEGKHTA
jgi:glycosyltransferase involved in cell wall biosynthesis